MVTMAWLGLCDYSDFVRSVVTMALLVLWLLRLG